MTHHFRPFAAVAICLAAVLANTTLAALPAQADDHLDDIRRTPPRAAAPVVAPATDQFIVGIKGGPGIASEAAVTSEAAGKAAGKLDIAARNIKGTAAGGQVVKTSRPLPAAEAAAFLASLRSSPGVAYAEPDIIMYPSAVAPNDPWYPAQWNLWEETAGIRAPQAWAINRGEGAVVAVVDTGITSHSELNSRVLPGYDMVSDVETARDGNGRDANPQDEGDWCVGENPFSSWHGTHVAGTIAAVGNNNKGIIGVAPEAKLLPVRAIGACGGYASDVADSIIWAAGGQVAGSPVNPNPARVINVSVGGEEPLCSVTQQNAINFAHKAGAAVVVAAGNSGENAAGTSPANCQNVIAVAAAGRDGGRASYSNYGPAVDVTAPGGDTSNQGDIPNPYAEGILSTSNFGSASPEQEAYALLEGTSMAAPHIAGVAALLMSQKGSTYTPDMVEKRLKATARPLPVACAEGCGAGLVDAATALTSAAYVAPSVSPFHDVSTGQQFYREMAWLAQRGISTGWVEDGRRLYRPLQSINRDAMAAFLYRMAGSPDYTAPAESPFDDVVTGQQFYKEMAWLAESGISKGWVEDGRRLYRPLQSISRDAMAAFLYRMAGSPDYTAPAGSPFADVVTGQQFYKEMAWLAEKGISTGWVEDGRRLYRPLQAISRDAMAAFLFRLNIVME
ncbi:S8 family peptidase [Pseudarthrobacter oxydans]|uniref:S8 family peptidase n=1 Tax=Pseudarthrobacter oxydans TaxID=1671 RepID=UPI0034453FE1